MSSGSFTERVKEIIQSIPRGKVAIYGQIALIAGNPRGARQVSWILHSCSEKHRLPWQRVINSRGSISLPAGGGYELQKQLLEQEGICFEDEDRIDLNRFLWSPGKA